MLSWVSPFNSGVVFYGPVGAEAPLIAGPYHWLAVWTLALTDVNIMRLVGVSALSKKTQKPMPCFLFLIRIQ